MFRYLCGSLCRYRSRSGPRPTLTARWLGCDCTTGWSRACRRDASRSLLGRSRACRRMLCWSDAWRCELRLCAKCCDRRPFPPRVGDGGSTGRCCARNCCTGGRSGWRGSRFSVSIISWHTSYARRQQRRRGCKQGNLFACFCISSHDVALRRRTGRGLALTFGSRRKGPSINWWDTGSSQCGSCRAG